MHGSENPLQYEVSSRWVLRLVPALGATVVLFLICLSAFSQSNQGTIQGGIFDQTGGAIAGASGHGNRRGARRHASPYHR